MPDAVDVRGARLAYESAGDGRPFLWGHGLTSSRRREAERQLFDWSTVADVARVIRYDARGHGHSPATPDEADYRWDSLALDYLGVADALGLDRFVGGGASMGAATTLHAAVLAPERFDALVLAIPPTAWATRAAQAGVYRKSADVLQRKGLAVWKELAARQPVPAIIAADPLFTGPDPDVAEADLPTVMRGAASSDLPGPDAITAIDRPTLVLAWTTDPVHPVATAEALHDLLGGDLHVATTMDEVRAWPGRVREFLAALP